MRAGKIGRAIIVGLLAAGAVLAATAAAHADYHWTSPADDGTPAADYHWTLGVAADDPADGDYHWTVAPEGGTLGDEDYHWTVAPEGGGLSESDPAAPETVDASR